MSAWRVLLSEWVVVFLKPGEHIFVIFIKTDFGYPVLALWFYCPQTLKNYLIFQSFNFESVWLPWNQKKTYEWSEMSAPMWCHSYPTFMKQLFFASTLFVFIFEFMAWVVVFLKPGEHIFVIFIKTDFGYPVLALWFYCPQTLKNYLIFQSFNFESVW
jgi:hypothetical protein